MVSDIFGTLLEDIGKKFGDITLRPDKNNSCLIKLKGGTEIQLEMDHSGQFLVMGCKLGEIPPGRYRENLLKEALKANNLPYPLHGVLAYSQKGNTLILYQKLIVNDQIASTVASEIPEFAEKAKVWLTAIQQSNLPTINLTEATQKTGGGMFGLR